MKGTHNCRVKYWIDPSGQFRPYELMAFNVPIFRKSDNFSKKNERSTLKIEKTSPAELAELGLSPFPFPEGEDGATQNQRDFLSEAKRRAIRKCRDLGVCNPDLNIFATFTLDGAKIYRYDYKQIIKSLNVWLDNRVRREGLKYLIVPELHKDGAIHFHGLLNDKLSRVNSGVKHHGKVVYNLPEWTLGFTTAQRITGADCVRKTTEYVLKYITKSADKIGGRYYLHGGAFDAPRTLCYNIDIDTLPARPFEVAPGVEVVTLRNELTISDLLTKIIDREMTENEVGLYIPTSVENSL